LEPTGSTDTSLRSKVADVKMANERRVKFEPNLSSITERIKTLSTMAAIAEANFFDKENEYFDLHAKIPRMYSGPIVYGWPPNKNRSVSLYINPNDSSTFLMFPNSEKRENCTMLIVVHTMPGWSILAGFLLSNKIRKEI
jgi:hypothetical protein